MQPWSPASWPTPTNHFDTLMIGTSYQPSTNAMAQVGIAFTPPPVPTPAPAAPAAPATSSSTGFVKWGLALVALWFTLVAVHDISASWAQLADAIAVAIAIGMLLVKGPKAMQNAQLSFK